MRRRTEGTLAVAAVTPSRASTRLDLASLPVTAGPCTTLAPVKRRQQRPATVNQSDKQTLALLHEANMKDRKLDTDDAHNNNVHTHNTHNTEIPNTKAMQARLCVHIGA